MNIIRISFFQEENLQRIIRSRILADDNITVDGLSKLKKSANAIGWHLNGNHLDSLFNMFAIKIDKWKHRTRRMNRFAALPANIPTIAESYLCIIGKNNLSVIIFKLEIWFIEIPVFSRPMIKIKILELGAGYYRVFGDFTYGFTFFST